MTRLIISDAFVLSNPKHGSVGQGIMVMVGAGIKAVHTQPWKVMNKNLEQEMLLRRYNKTVCVLKQLCLVYILTMSFSFSKSSIVPHIAFT